jgi:ATP phosphoribosyltransferase
VSEKLRFAVPNGSLWERLCMHLATAGYPLRPPDRTGLCGESAGIQFHQLDRRMIPAFMQTGAFHAGLTGLDLWENSGLHDGLRVVDQFSFSRTTDQPSRWVLARRKDVPLAGDGKDRPVKVACELPRLAEILLKQAGLPADCQVIRIDGSEEMCVKHGIADAVLVVTETGRSIRENGLEILPGCDSLLVSRPEIRALPDLADSHEEALQALSFALQAVVSAQAYITVSFDIPAAVDLDALHLPASVAPTVAPLTDPAWKACEICIPRAVFGPTLVRLKRAGARGIVMNDTQGYLA